MLLEIGLLKKEKKKQTNKRKEKQKKKKKGKEKSLGYPNFYFYDKRCEALMAIFNIFLII